ncbi:hypothetical protein HY641_00235 [Candidatus Woesearchaeota archaeon]|nr:hypothetical protein [Candidatus Woesearchaeota archaeon]
MKSNVDHRLMINTLLLVLTFFVLLNLFLTYDLRQEVAERVRLDALSRVPPMMELVVISDDSCVDCFNISPVVSQIKAMNVNLTKESVLQYGSDEARAQIEKYSVQSIPSVILLGAPETFSLSGFKRTKDALILSEVRPIYIDATTGQAKGRLEMTLINDPSCKGCFNIGIVAGQIKRLTSVRQEITLSSASAQAKKLIAKYNITKLPALILSEDTSVYAAIASEWANVGTVESDGMYVLRELPPPYVDVATGQVVGRVSVTYLTDVSCKACYDVSIHKAVLAQLGIAPAIESRMDVASAQGKMLVAKYGIESVPTVILSRDAKAFDVMSSVWEQVGTIESDGSYVFRNLGAIGGVTYHNLSSGAVQNATLPQQ